MRLLYLLTTVLILSSCGTGKIRLVRHQKIIETNETLESLANKELSPKGDQVSSPTFKTTPSANDTRPDAFSDQTTSEQEQQTITESQFPQIPEDSTTLSAQDKADIEYEALRAEKTARGSAIFSALFIFFVALSILLSFLLWIFFNPIPTIVALAAAVISYIVGIILYIKARRSRYITSRGERLQRTSLGFIIANSLLILLFTVLIFL
jgi:Flp pilus assembly protein TadB